MEQWSANQVKEYFEELLARKDREYDHFEETVAARFIQVNEFRGALQDLSKDMATRRELTSATEALNARAEVNRNAIAELRSRIDTGPAQLPILQSRLDLSQGRSEGIHLTTGVLFAAVGALAAFLTVLVIAVNLLTR